MIIAVIPEPSSPKNGRPHPTQLPTACRGEPSPLAQCDSNAHNPLTLGSGWLYYPDYPVVAHQPRGGWLPIPSARASRQRDKERGDPAVSSIRGLGALPTTGCRRGYMGWGKHGLPTGQGRSWREAPWPQWPSCLVVRQDACRLAVGWALAQYTTVSRECVSCSACCLRHDEG